MIAAYPNFFPVCYYSQEDEETKTGHAGIPSTEEEEAKGEAAAPVAVRYVSLSSADTYLALHKHSISIPTSIEQPLCGSGGGPACQVLQTVGPRAGDLRGASVQQRPLQ